jgi:UDP-glucose 4-epimerase
MKLDDLPFHIGATEAAGNPAGLPDTWPFSLHFNLERGAITQQVTPELLGILDQAYRSGHLIGTPLAEDSYPTPDGTGVRDYIHVVDLADGHVTALDYLQRHGGMLTVNLGSGRGHSVMDVVKAFERATGQAIPWRVANRRSGDIPQFWADPGLARRMLGWETKRSLDQMCADAWRWQQRCS